MSEPSLRKRLTNNGGYTQPAQPKKEDADTAIWGGIDLPDRPPITPRPQGDEPPTPPANAITIESDGRLLAERFVVTETGIQFDGALSESEWVEIGKIVKTMSSAASWGVGDWAVYASDHLGINYDESARRLGLETSTVKQYAYVCMNFPHGSRYGKAYFAHHRLLLGRGYTPQELKRKIRDAIGTDGRPMSVDEFKRKVLELDTPAPRPKFKDAPVKYVDYQVSALRDKIIEKAGDLTADERAEMADLFRMIARQIDELDG